jgi:RNA polymerase primary sigma factor
MQSYVADITDRIDELKKHYRRANQLAGRLPTIVAKQKARQYHHRRFSVGREMVHISLIVRNLGLTNCERQCLIDRVNRTVDIMRSLDCQVSNLGKKIENTRSENLKKDYRKAQRQYRGDLERLESDAGVSFQELLRTQRESCRVRRTRNRPNTSSSRPICASWFPSPRSMPATGYCSSI